jgi:hypothetical protein
LGDDGKICSPVSIRPRTCWRRRTMKTKKKKQVDIDIIHTQEGITDKAGLYRYPVCGNKSLFLQTHTSSQKHSAQVHSALATLSITARQAMHGGHQQTRQRKQGILHNMFISGHAQASPEAASARPSKHAYRGTIQQEVPPNQSHAELPQSTSHKRGPRDTARARGLIP